MKLKALLLFLTVILCCSLLNSCGLLIEEHITMPEYNKVQSAETKRLKENVIIDFKYDPFINVKVIKENNVYVEHIDSTYVNGIEQKITNALGELNVSAGVDSANYSLLVDNITIIEELVDRSYENSDGETEFTTENSFKAIIIGVITDKKHNRQEVIRTYNDKETYVGEVYILSLGAPTRNGNAKKNVILENMFTAFADEVVKFILNTTK